MDGWMDGRMDGRAGGQAVDYMDRLVYGQTDGMDWLVDG